MSLRLFNDALQTSLLMYFPTLGVTVNGETENMYKEVVVVYINVLSQSLPGATK